MADLFHPDAPETPKRTAAERKVLEAYERRPELLEVPCTREYCRARSGEYCHSARGNLCLPHVSRIDAADRQVDP